MPVSQDEGRAAPADGHRLEQVLGAAGLDTGSLARRPPVPDGSEVWELVSSGTGWFATWQRLRELVPRTGRWPVAVCTWGYDDDLVNRHSAALPGGNLPPAEVLLRLAAGTDLAVGLDRAESESFRQPLAESFDWHEDATRRRCGRAPSLAQVRDALGSEPSEMDLERWFLRWELTDGGLVPAPGEARYLDWFVPGPDQRVSLLLLPTVEPWGVAAWTTSFEGEWPDPALRPAVFRDWAQRLGAEPAANWGTMQQLVVTRPPSGLDEAFAVARTTSLLWPDTVAGPGVTVREHAVDLLGRTRWFLHLRP